MDDSVKKLSNEQLRAVKYNKGPLLIIAGAGTGKTTVITERIKYLVSSGLAKPEEILALTFTEKGATEMEERVDIALPLGYSQMWIMTFHSFCDHILRESAIHIGLDPKYDLMTEAESIDLLKKNIFDLNLDYFRPLGNPNKFLEGLLQHFSRLQDECVGVEEYLKFAKNYKNEDELEVKKTKELAIAYEKYNKLKIKKSLMDFGDLITNTLRLFKERPNVLKSYQIKFKYILIDEFQDTNFTQNILINELAQKYNNITTVGDDNQSIYRFRGAAISNIIQFKNNYPKAKVITLNKNYRSTQKILDCAYKLIKFNDPDTLEYQLGISKKLIAVNSERSTKIGFIHTQNSQDEAESVAKEIFSLVTNHKSLVTYGDIAILVRANNHADAFLREFERRGIPHQFLGPSKLFEKEEIVDLISYLKVLYNPEDSESLYRLLSSEIFNISSLELIKITSTAKRKSMSIFEVISDNSNQKVVELLLLLDKHLKIINKESAGQILFDYLNEVGIYKKIIENSEDTKAKNIAKFFEKIKAYEDENPSASLFDVVEYIDLLIEVGESPIVTEGDWQENDAVNILTIHSSKGLEFPVVFLVNLVNERFPSRERHEQIPIPDELIKEVLPQGDFHLQEERRLFYVGMTRAKERLYLTAAKFYGDGKREKKISPFVQEALQEIINYQLPIIKQNQISNYPNSKHITRNPSPETNKLVIRYLSVSQIETFKTCPMHYKLKYIYKIPTPMSASISFGISIHETLKDYYQTKKDILKVYKENFLEEGYENKKHKDLFFKKGSESLLAFLKKGYNPKINTIDLEKDFKIKITKDLMVGGKIDRIDSLGSGIYEVIDYKTGASIPTQKEVDKDLQLSVYAMAVSEMYGVAPEKIKLSLYFLDTQEKIITSRTTKQLEEVKKDILEVKKEIEESDFKCGNNYFCQQGCEFSMFCKSND